MYIGQRTGTPEKFRRMTETLRDAGVFGAVRGVLFGKPADEAHSTPRCIIPFGVDAVEDTEEQRIAFAAETK